jgi:hypothetical protein
MKKTLWLLGLIFILLSCKKDKLEGELSIFQGKWEWVETERTFTAVVGPVNITYDTIPANQSGVLDSYQIEFDTKGKVSFLKNNVLEEKYRIVFDGFHESTWSTDLVYSFVINLDNQGDQRFVGFVSESNLTTVEGIHIPLTTHTEYPTEISYRHIFAKVN